MEQIKRQISAQIENDFFKGKVIVLLGARQVGKSTLLKELIRNQKEDVLWMDAENVDIRLLLDTANDERLKQITHNYKIIVIDEAQKLANAGSTLKLFADYLKNKQVIASGSSAFELKNALNEPLTGRKFEYSLFPLSFKEMTIHTGILNETRKLPQRLVYGYYPDIVIQESDAERLLRFLSDSFLYKDIFLFKGIKKPEKMLDLLRLLAWQIGQEVSFNELGKTLQLDNQTIESYIHLLEQAFVIYRLPAYHSNHRSELRKSRKIYFNDTGIRNAVINDFRPIEIRQDTGALFENFFINEMRKQNYYSNTFANFYFWRNKAQAEVDLIIEKNGHIQAFECKWNSNVKESLSKSFSTLYPNHTFNVVNRENFSLWVL